MRFGFVIGTESLFWHEHEWFHLNIRYLMIISAVGIIHQAIVFKCTEVFSDMAVISFRLANINLFTIAPSEIEVELHTP
jgi:hypothetical protein